MKLHDYDTHEEIREATEEESAASRAEEDGLLLLDVRPEQYAGEDYRRCYVSE